METHCQLLPNPGRNFSLFFPQTRSRPAPNATSPHGIKAWAAAPSRTRSPSARIFSRSHPACSQLSLPTPLTDTSAPFKSTSFLNEGFKERSPSQPDPRTLVIFTQPKLFPRGSPSAAPTAPPARFPQPRRARAHAPLPQERAGARNPQRDAGTAAARRHAGSL